MTLQVLPKQYCCNPSTHLRGVTWSTSHSKVAVGHQERVGQGPKHLKYMPGCPTMHFIQVQGFATSSDTFVSLHTPGLYVGHPTNSQCCHCLLQYMQANLLTSKA